MTAGTAAEWWLMKRLSGAANVLLRAPGGVHPFPVPAQVTQVFIEFRRLPGESVENSMCSEVTLSDFSYEVVAVGDTGARGYMPLMGAQSALIAALSTGYVSEQGTEIPDLGTVPAMLVEWVEEVREPELREGGGIRRRLGGVYRFRVTP